MKRSELRQLIKEEYIKLNEIGNSMLADKLDKIIQDKEKHIRWNGFYVDMCHEIKKVYDILNTDCCVFPPIVTNNVEPPKKIDYWGWDVVTNPHNDSVSLEFGNVFDDVNIVKQWNIKQMYKFIRDTVNKKLNGCQVTYIEFKAKNNILDVQIQCTKR